MSDENRLFKSIREIPPTAQYKLLDGRRFYIVNKSATTIGIFLYQDHGEVVLEIRPSEQSPIKENQKLEES